MGQRVSREGEAAPQPEQEEKGSRLFGWLFSPNAGEKRTRDHEDVDEQGLGLPATKKTKTDEETTSGEAFSNRFFLPFQSKQGSNETKPSSPLKPPAIDWGSVNEGCIPQPPYGSYIAFAMERRPELQREHPNVEGVEISKMLGAEWRASAELRQEYKDRQDKLKAEYKAKLAELGLPIPKIQKKPKKPKLSKEKRVDDGRPKRPITTYLRFSKEYRPILKQENPSATGAEINEALAERWKEISDELRAKYSAEYVIELESYNQEMEKWAAAQRQKPSDVGKQVATETGSSAKQAPGPDISSTQLPKSSALPAIPVGRTAFPKRMMKLPTKSTTSSKSPTKQPAKSAAAPTSQQSKIAGTPKSPAKQQSNATLRLPPNQTYKSTEASIGGKPDLVHPGQAVAQIGMAAASNPVVASSLRVTPALPQAAIPPSYYNPSVYSLPYGYNPAAYPYAYAYSYNVPQPPRPILPMLPKPSETTKPSKEKATQNI